MLGMALLSIVIAIPFRRCPRSLTWLHNGIQATVGLATIVLGSYVILDIGTKISTLPAG